MCNGVQAQPNALPALSDRRSTMRRPSPFGRHPFIAFTATVVLAVAASVATFWLDSAAPAADTLLQKDPGALLSSM